MIRGLLKRTISKAFRLLAVVGLIGLTVITTPVYAADGIPPIAKPSLAPQPPPKKTPVPVTDGSTQTTSKGTVKFDKGEATIASGSVTFTSAPYLDNQAVWNKVRGANGKVNSRTDVGASYDAGTDATIIYNNYANKIKEITILKRKMALKYQINGDVSVTLLADGTISIAKGNTSIGVEAPVAWDALNSPVPVWFTVQGANINVGYDDRTAIYPVTIDPTYVILSTNLSPEASTWGMPGWKYKKQLAIGNGTIAENLTNLPVMVRLTTANFDFTKAQSDGRDVRFWGADSGGTWASLSYEIEKWDAVGEEAIIWVKVPYITASVGSDYIEMYYGNLVVADGQSVTGVWDANYEGVYHFTGVNGSGYWKNSVTNTYTGIPSGAVSVTTSGYAGSAVLVDTGGGVDILDGSDQPDQTVEVAYKRSYSTDASYRIVTTGHLGDGGAGLFIRESDASPKYQVLTNDAGLAPLTSIPSVIGAGEQGNWNYHGVSVDFVLNGGLTFWETANILWQVGGNVGETGTITQNVVGFRADDTNVIQMGVLDSASDIARGTYDELRYSKVSRTAGWLKASQLSITNTYLTYGSEQISTPSSSRRIVRKTDDSWYTAISFPNGTNDYYTAAVYKSADNGVTWALFHNLNTSYRNTNPTLAVDSQNRLHAAWQNVYTSYSIRYDMETVSGGAWLGSTNVVTGPNPQVLPSIVIMPDDSAVVAWSGVGFGANPTKFSLEAIPIVAGVVGAAESIENIAYDLDRGVALTVTSDAVVHAVWEGFGYGGAPQFRSIVYSARAIGGGSWGASSALVLAGTADVRFPSLASDLSDNLHLTYLTGVYAEYKKKAAGGAWTAGVDAITGVSAQGRPSISLERSTGRPLIAISGLGWGTNVGNYNVVLSKQAADLSWPVTPTSISDTAYDNFDVSLLFGRYPVISTVQTNYPRAGYAMTFYSPTGSAVAGIKFFKSTDLSFSTATLTTVAASNLAVSNLTASATLNATVTSIGSDASATLKFYYGYTAAYGSTSASQTITIPGNYSQAIGGLSAGRTVYFVVSVTNSAGESIASNPLTFTTSAPAEWNLMKGIIPVIIAFGIIIAIWFALKKGTNWKAILMIIALGLLAYYFATLMFNLTW